MRACCAGARDSEPHDVDGDVRVGITTALGDVHNAIPIHGDELFDRRKAEPRTVLQRGSQWRLSIILGVGQFGQRQSPTSRRAHACPAINHEPNGTYRTVASVPKSVWHS